jgi:hypothetical protein
MPGPGLCAPKWKKRETAAKFRTITVFKEQKHIRGGSCLFHCLPVSPFFSFKSNLIYNVRMRTWAGWVGHATSKEGGNSGNLELRSETLEYRLQNEFPGPFDDHHGVFGIIWSLRGWNDSALASQEPRPGALHRIQRRRTSRWVRFMDIAHRLIHFRSLSMLIVNGFRFCCLDSQNIFFHQCLFGDVAPYVTAPHLLM